MALQKFSFCSSNAAQQANLVGIDDWPCHACTFQNDASSVQCTICGTHRARTKKRASMHDHHDSHHNINTTPSKKRKLINTELNDENINNVNSNTHCTETPVIDIDSENDDESYFGTSNNSPSNHGRHNHNLKQSSSIADSDQKHENESEHGHDIDLDSDDNTLQIMHQFGFQQPKLDSVIKEEKEQPLYDDDHMDMPDGHATKDALLEINDSHHAFDIDFSSHLSDDEYAYYSGEDFDALDWSGSKYANRKLFKLEECFFEWKQTYTGCVLMIQNGYKYEFYEEDAFIVSTALGVTANNKYGTLLKALLPEQKLETYIRRLVEVGLMVAVIQQTETLQTKQDKKAKMIHRELTGVYAKGTFFAPHITDITTDTAIHNQVTDEFPESRYILSFHEIPMDNDFNNSHGVEFHLVLVDLYSGILRYDSFQDTFLRPKFVTVLNHFNIVEIILPNDQISKNTLNLLRARYPKLGSKQAVRWTNYALAEFEYSECNALLIETYSENHSDWVSEILNWDKSVLISFTMLVHYLRKCGFHESLVCCNIQSIQNAIYMKLNGVTTQHLEVFVNKEGGTKCTLFELLSRNNATKFGTRLMQQWVSRPLCSVKQIRLRQNAVTGLMEHYEMQTSWFMELVRQLSVCTDLERRLRIIQCKKCPPKLFLKTMKEFQDILHKLPKQSDCDQMDKDGLLYSLFCGIPSTECLAIIDEFTSNLNLEMQGYDDALKDISKYPTLVECSKDIEHCHRALEKTLNEIRVKLKNPNLMYKHVKNDKYLIEVPKDKYSEHEFPNGWKLVNGTKNFSRYQPPNVVHIVNQLACDEEKLLIESKRAWFHFLDDFNKSADKFCSLVSVLAEIDCLYSLAVLATNVDYVLPQFLDEECKQNDNDEVEQILQIQAARHPTLEEYLSSTENNTSYGPQKFISNDIDLSSSGTSQMVITGPNMGGKSVYIKMIGCLVVMAQIGSYVPAESMRLTVFDMVGSRIGIYDNILHDQSTFFVEMSETAHLLDVATRKSFLILDEIGRGTSTVDGTAIAYAILKYVTENIKCCTLFVTHYNELLRMKNECRNEYGQPIENYHMMFRHDADSDDIQFLYKIVKGECKESYGIQVAKLGGIEDEIVQKAKEHSHTMKQHMTADEDETKEKFIALLTILNIAHDRRT